MTELRNRMIQAMTLRGLRPKTRKTYVDCIVHLTRFFRRSPAKLSGEDLRGWVRHLTDRNLSSQRLRQHFAAMRFLYGRTLGREEDVAFMSCPRDVQKLPDVLSADDVEMFLSELKVPVYRVLCTLLYATGLRLTEALRSEEHHVCTPVTIRYRMPSSACKKKKIKL